MIELRYREIHFWVAYKIYEACIELIHRFLYKLEVKWRMFLIFDISHFWTLREHLLKFITKISDACLNLTLYFKNHFSRDVQKWWSEFIMWWVSKNRNQMWLFHDSVVLLLYTFLTLFIPPPHDHIQRRGKSMLNNNNKHHLWTYLQNTFFKKFHRLHNNCWSFNHT